MKSALDQGSSERVVEALYKALSSRDVLQVHKLLAPDIEWWYHGPPNHQHLMRLLTGSSQSKVPFNFIPLSINAFGSMVVVEEHDKEHSVTWVHAWTVDENSRIIISVREYLNTWLTVTQLDDYATSSLLSSTSSSSSSLPSVWESQHSKTDVPRLLLAI